MKRGAVLVAALMACAVVHAASWRVTLLVPANDERLSRTRLERGALGHPGGPVADALKIAAAAVPRTPVVKVPGAPKKRRRRRRPPLLAQMEA